MKKMQEIMLHESTYASERQETVIPYLRLREGEYYFEREPGKKIYCVSYRIEHPKAVVVISHGFCESALKLQEPIYYFLRQGYDVVLPEHCGHGRSYRLTKDPSLVHVDSYTRYIQDLLYVIRKTRENHRGLPLVLFGHSMGGGIAAETAAEAPWMVDALILSSPMIRPLTGDLPWSVARSITEAMCRVGRGGEYVAGQKPFDDTETCAQSGARSRARFAWYYENVKRKDPRYQTSAASYGWLRSAARLSDQLLKTAYRSLDMPVLMVQAGRDNLVSNEDQIAFMRKIKKNGNRQAWLLRFPEAKHEFYNADDVVVEEYWTQVFRFLDRVL